MTAKRAISKALSTTHTVSHLTDRLTGRDGGLRPSKPTAQGDDGLTQYVWRMARFHAGHDMRVPISAAFDLAGWLESQLGRKVHTIDQGLRDAEKTLDPVVNTILLRLGHSPYQAALRYRRAGLI